MLCNQCPRKCNVDRNVRYGYCQTGDSLRVAKFMLHHWEEPCISGTKGSGTIFFSGCSLRCVYCQNYEISHLGKGKNISTKDFIDIVKKLEKMGAHNINLVTPTHFFDKIVEAFNIYRPHIPIVYNCSGYEDVSMLHKLKGFVDIYLVDCKYYDEALSSKYSACPDYFKIAKNAIIEMKKQQPTDQIVDGIMQKGVIVRHMVLPECSDDSIKILDWLHSEFGNKVTLSLMNQYTPYYKASDYPELNHRTKPIEYTRVLLYARKLGFDGYMQDKSSSGCAFIPDFDDNDL